MQPHCLFDIHPAGILGFFQRIAEALPQLNRIPVVLLLELRQSAVSRGVIVHDLDLVFRSVSLLLNE
jgi:hypothetical protein